MTQHYLSDEQREQSATAVLQTISRERADSVVAQIESAAIAAYAAQQAAHPATGGAEAVPDGYKLAPVEATQEMCRAAVIYANGEAVYKNVNAEALTIEEGIYAEVYEAMLAKSPSPGPVAVAGQGDEALMREALESMESAVEFRETGQGRPPEQTCMDAIAALRRRLATPASPAPHEGAKPVAHYLVVTGEVHEGQETYTVHDKPVPLADNWKLYAAPQEHEARDAARWHWITEDHADRETREKCREILGRLPLMSYSAACAAVDAARAVKGDRTG